MATSLRVVEKESMEDKPKALDAALGQIERAFGKGSIMRLGDEQAVEVETISTGSLGLDIGLGLGGVPRGRVVEISERALGGREGSAEARRRINPGQNVLIERLEASLS